MQMNNTHQQEQTDNDTFALTLSISTETAQTKKEAEFITEFQLHENIPVNETSLRPILTKHLQSTNLWYKNSANVGKCSQDNYSGMTGITVDYDHIMTIQQFKSLYSNYHFVLYPSTNHKQTKDEHGLEIEKIHVIFPLDPKDYDNYNTANMHARAYQ